MQKKKHLHHTYFQVISFSMVHSYPKYSEIAFAKILNQVGYVRSARQKFGIHDSTWLRACVETFHMPTPSFFA
jgi:hypothetical protein